MATIRGESKNKTVTADYETHLKRIYLYLPPHQLIRFDGCDLKAICEALENVKSNIIATLGADHLK